LDKYGLSNRTELCLKFFILCRCFCTCTCWFDLGFPRTVTSSPINFTLLASGSIKLLPLVCLTFRL